MSPRPARVLGAILALSAARAAGVSAQGPAASGVNRLRPTCSSFYGALRGLRGADSAAGLTVRGLLGSVAAAAKEAPLLPLDFATGLQQVCALRTRYEKSGAPDPDVVAAHADAMAALLGGIRNEELRGLERKGDWAALADRAAAVRVRLSAGRPYLALSCADDPAAVWERSGTISALDAQKRLLTLKSSAGEIEILVPPDASVSDAAGAPKNAAALRAGDAASIVYARPAGPLRIRLRAR